MILDESCLGRRAGFFGGVFLGGIVSRAYRSLSLFVSLSRVSADRVENLLVALPAQKHAVVGRKHGSNAVFFVCTAPWCGNAFCHRLRCLWCLYVVPLWTCHRSLRSDERLAAIFCCCFFQSDKDRTGHCAGRKCRLAMKL